MRSALELLGANVVLVDSYDKAVEAYRTNAFDAVLSDIDLGEERTGLDVVRALRSAPGQASVFLALSAYGAQKDHEAARSAGFDALLVKPTDLASVARELVRRRSR